MFSLWCLREKPNRTNELFFFPSACMTGWQASSSLALVLCAYLSIRVTVNLSAGSECDLTCTCISRPHRQQQSSPSSRRKTSSWRASWKDWRVRSAFSPRSPTPTNCWPTSAAWLSSSTICPPRSKRMNRGLRFYRWGGAFCVLLKS